MNSALILGSNSFAGSCLINYLLNKNFKIIGISRSKEKNEYELIYKKNLNIKNFQYYQIEINKNLKNLINLIKAKKPNFIIDFLGQGMVAESWNNPDQWFNTNVLSKIKLLTQLSKYDFIKKYIRISTPEVYGHSDNFLKENTNYNPSSPYAITHVSIDLYLKILFQNSKFPSIIMRFSNFYGESQQLYRIIPKTIMSILTKKKLPLHGNGSSLRSFIYIDDFCSAIYAGIKKGRIGEVYNVSSNQIFSVAEIIKIICSKMNYNFKNLIKHYKDRPGKDYKYFMSSKKIKKELGWKNNISFLNGIDKTIKWYKKNYNNFKNIKYEYIHKK
jgi:dTDP-glucose 4,6-dehydratase